VLALVVGGGLVRTTAVPSAAAAPPVVSIPFEVATHHIIVKVRVNKSRPLAFLLDTGASDPVVRLDVARQLGLTLQGTITGRGSGAGTQTGSRVRNATWSLDGLDGFSQPLGLALPLSNLSPSMGRDIDGIIGGTFIREFVVELDYQARVMRLHDRRSFAYNGTGESLPLEFNEDNHPVITAAVTAIDGSPIERRFHLDTGSGLALVLHSPFVAEQHLPPPGTKTIRAIGTAGIGGRSVGRIGRVLSLRIGSSTIANPITLFSEDTAGTFANRTFAANIGGQIAERFRMFLDYAGRRIILERSSIFADPFDRAYSGASLRAEGSDYRTFRVREVLEDSPAAEAGLAEGDVITSIDDLAADHFTLSAINELFEKSATHRLTIRRGDRTLEIALTPRPLI